jgi:hypothetical protein
MAGKHRNVAGKRGVRAIPWAPGLAATFSRGKTGSILELQAISRTCLNRGYCRFWELAGERRLMRLCGALAI